MKAWAIKDKHGNIKIYSIDFTKPEAIYRFINQPWVDIKWKKLYGRGYRAVEIKIKEAKP